METEAYYNRVMSDKLINILNGEKYKWLIDFVKKHKELDFQTGSNDKKSWFSIYRGTSRILTLQCGKRGILNIDVAESYKNLDEDFYKREKWEKKNVVDIKKQFEALLEEINKSEKFGSYYINKGEKKEGYYQTLISRRYTLDYKKEDDLLIFDKEFVIGYKDKDTKGAWQKPSQKWAMKKIGEIKTALGEKCPKEIKVPGDECDLVGINKNGDLVLLEIKRHGDSTKVYLAPLQVAMYGQLVKNLLKKYKDDIENVISKMLEQKKTLKMLPDRIEMPKRLSGNVKLAVVVGGDASDEEKPRRDEVKKRFNKVRGVIGKEITYYYYNKKDRKLIQVDIFKELEKEKQQHFIKNKDKIVFGNVEGFGIFDKKPRLYVLNTKYVDNNLYEGIRENAKKYMTKNGIKWWGDKDASGTEPSGHTLSSQIACLNHLFAIKNDDKAVLAMLNGVRTEEYDKVLPIPYDDEKDRGYIAFEVISKNEYLGEVSQNRKRGEYCTSIDAFVYAHHKPTNKNHIILIEWKYTESYKDKDESSEVDKGETRMKRYNNLINESKMLDHLSEEGCKYPDNVKNYQGSVYYQEPFYQLMRQTLWAEQVVEHRKGNNKVQKKEPIDAFDYLHIHVVPSDNKDLLCKGFPNVGDTMEETWKKMLTDKGKERYIIIDPEDLLDPLKKIPEYKDLISYLKKRYWSDKD